MQPYIELNAHHIGKSHIQSGLLCEDYSATYSDDQISIVVISDGHGDKNCFRSEKAQDMHVKLQSGCADSFRALPITLTTSNNVILKAWSPL